MFSQIILKVEIFLKTINEQCPSMSLTLSPRLSSKQVSAGSMILFNLLLKNNLETKSQFSIYLNVIGYFSSD